MYGWNPFDNIRDWWNGLDLNPFDDAPSQPVAVSSGIDAKSVMAGLVIGYLMFRD